MAIKSVENINVDEHKILTKYRDAMFRIVKSLYPEVNTQDIINGLNYSIQKRFKNFDLQIHNNYTNKTVTMTMLDICDYISKKEPIITSYGVLFKRHDVVPNPMGKVIDSFLTLRKQHKKEMFKYPKNSEQFEYYNLLQQLDKIDVNRNSVPSGTKVLTVNH